MDEESDNPPKPLIPRTSNQKGQGLVRKWTERHRPFAYERFTELDGGGKKSIYFRFENAPGSDRMDSAAYAILNELKLFDGEPSALKYVRDKRLGKVWHLPDNPKGRTISDIIDARLDKLAEKMEKEPSQER